MPPYSNLRDFIYFDTIDNETSPFEVSFASGIIIFSQIYVISLLS